jgi:hypothetical protein
MEKNGMIERRKDGIMNITQYSNIPIVFWVYPIFQSSRLMWGYPLFHYSNIPIFQYSKGGIHDS